jgi:hypothetical protein
VRNKIRFEVLEIVLIDAQVLHSFRAKLQLLDAGFQFPIARFHRVDAVEVDYIDSRVDVDGTFGLIKGQNLSGKTAYAWLQWQF